MAPGLRRSRLSEEEISLREAIETSREIFVQQRNEWSEIAIDFETRNRDVVMDTIGASIDVVTEATGARIDLDRLRLL